MPHSIDDFKDLSEDGFRRHVLIPLLQAMGYRQVEHTHGPNELGKDVVFWHETRLGSRENVAIVAKRGSINAKASGDVKTIGEQIRQAFNAPFLDKLDGTEQHVHKVVVAASGKIRQEAKKAIRSVIDHGLHDRHVVFWDNYEIASFLNQHLPRLSIPNELETIRQRLNDLEYFKVTPELGPKGVFYHIEAKDEGAEFASGAFSFPDTPEGNAMMKSVEKFFREGGEVTIPGEFIESFNQHYELSEIFGNEIPALIRMGPNVPGKPHPVRVEVESDGRVVTYDDLDLRLVRAGTHRTELRTSHDGPLHLTIVLEDLGTEGKQTTTLLRFEPFGQTVRQVLKASRIWRALSEGGVYRLVDSRSSDSLTSPQAVPEIDSPSDEFVTYVENLAFIEDHLGWTLSFPDEISNRDDLDASELRQILEHGSFAQPFDTYSATLTPNKENDFDLLAAFPPGEIRWLRITGDQTKYDILDRSILLGPGHSVFQAMLTEDEHERIARHLREGTQSFKITFTAPPRDMEMRCYYRNYLPEEKRKEYDSFRDKFPPSSPDHPVELA